MLREFASRIFRQVLEVRVFRSYAALQRPFAQPWFPRHVPQSRPLAREKLFHDSFDLIGERFLSQLLAQFGLHLRCDQSEMFGIVCQERPIDVPFYRKQACYDAR